MDNPWATAWDHPRHPHPQDAWSAPGWPAPQGTVWPQPNASRDPSASAASEQDQHGISHSPAPVAAGLNSTAGTSVSDHQPARSTSPPLDSSDLVPETSDGNVAPVTSVSRGEDLQTVINPPEGDWSTAWGTAPSPGANLNETRPPDQWEAARQEKEKLNRAVPPELLESLLHHCQQVSQEIWPACETKYDDNWRSGFGSHPDITALLAQLLPADSTLPPALQFSATATAKAMNEALKLTRHLSASASSPLSRLLASRGSLEWEKSVKAKQDVILDTAHVGWRVLEKEDRLSTVEESKSRKVTSGLLSFWNRKASAIQTPPVETPSERSSSPARSSQESVKSAPRPPSSRAASPSKASTTPVPPPPPIDSQATAVATAPAPSAVSRFLNRFSRVRGTQHGALALSSDDLEFLSDLVPSATDEDINDSALDALMGASHSSPLLPKLPPPIPPPPKQSIQPCRPSSALPTDSANVIGSASTAPQMQTADHTLNVPLLAPPLSPKPATSFSRTHSSTVASRQSNTPLIQQTLQPRSQLNPRSQSPSMLPPPQKTLPLLSIPPLLPPPPVSPPQTPRPNSFTSVTRSTDTSSFHDLYDTDDEFSAFTSFPPSASASFQSSEPYPSRGPPSPPSPPPRRSYERTHYHSSSPTSLMSSPTSQSSLDQLYSTKSSISASLDSFDDFVSPPPVARGENKKPTPSLPPLPVKSRSQHQKPPRLDTFTPRVCHVHTPSQTLTSPTVHTGLINGAFLGPSVSDAEHRRTQMLVSHAAARGGMLWPNSPDVDEPQVRVIPPPPSAPMSPKSLIGQEDVDLLGDGDALGSALVAKRSSNVVGVSPSATLDASRASFGIACGLGKELELRNQLQSSPPPLPSTSTPIFLFPLGDSLPLVTTNPRSSQPAKPKQTGGLSAQDLSFFEGL